MADTSGDRNSFIDACGQQQAGIDAQTREARMIPTIGRIVLYKLGEQDAAKINRRRTTSGSIVARMASSVPVHDGDEPSIYAWPAGAQAHIGNNVEAGETYPMVICRIWGSTPESAVNGQVLLDGNDTYWATSSVCGENLGNWAWPTIQK